MTAPTTQDVERYVGLPYDARRFDCADLALLVARELYGRDVHLPGRPRPLRDDEQAAAISAYTAELAVAVQVPVDGDLVLMRDLGDKQPGHLGIFVRLGAALMVLHTSHVLGGSRLHRLRDLPGLGLSVEGYYRWK